MKYCAVAYITGKLSKAVVVPESPLGGNCPGVFGLGLLSRVNPVNAETNSTVSV